MKSYSNIEGANSQKKKPNLGKNYLKRLIVLLSVRYHYRSENPLTVNKHKDVYYLLNK